MRGAAFAIATLLCLNGNIAEAQVYPSKPIRLIVPFSAGGPPDVVARIIAHKLTPELGRQVIVDNRPGAGGTIGAAAAAKAPADGHVLFFASTSTLSIAPGTYANPGYDPIKSFAPISQITTAPFLVMVHPSVPARSLRELIKLAKAKPGQLNFGASNGGITHVAGEMFKRAAGVNLVHVSYKVNTQAAADFLAGHTQVRFEQLATLDQHIKAGRIRALAVAHIKRHPQLPEVPTSAEAGLPGYEVTSWFGLVAPAGTPADVIRRLNLEVLKALEMKDVRETLANQGLEAMGSSPEAFAVFIGKELAKWTAAVKASGARAD
jgi:tripartite-type tricarboxylate transporter receptor subunit TctC